jgi:cytidylate kinase
VKSLVIAIDGPAASGKGTLARRLAASFGLPYLDTGLLYRAVGRLVLERGGDPARHEDAEAAALALQPDDLARDDLRGPEADRAASAVASIPGVRAALLGFQRGFAASHGAVLDGRDIGTIVFPDAGVKLFVTASLPARAGRRYAERLAAGAETNLAEVQADLAARDEADRTRAAAPLKPAADALLLDTSALDADQAFARAVELIRSVVNSAGPHGGQGVEPQG